MKTRIEAGTDIAKIGAWDASRNDAAIARVSIKKLEQTWEEDCSTGNLFLIRTGADGGGPIDVYVEETAPPDVRKQFRERKREFLVSIPSGRLLVGGLEDYRTGKARITAADSIVTMTPGNYALRCLVPKGEVDFEQPTRDELDAAIGVEDHRFYRRVQKIALTGYLGVPVIFGIVAIVSNWKKALAVAAAFGVLCYAIVLPLSRTKRFRRASKIVGELWKQAYQRGLPTFIFELRRVEDTAGLKGGSMRLNN